MISDSLIEAARFALAKEGGQLIQTVHEVLYGVYMHKGIGRVDGALGRP